MKKTKINNTRNDVIYSRKKHLDPVPEVGRKYHCFDDGKITFSRHYIVEVSDVVGHMKFRKQYPEQFLLYRLAVKQCYWLFSTHSDKFIICRKGDNDTEVFVRTKQGDWFSIGGFFNSGLLDVTGRIWENLVKNIDNFSYSEEEKKRLIEENRI